MTISLVSAGSAASGGQTASPSFGQSTTAGNLLVAFTLANGVVGEEITDDIICSGSGWYIARSTYGAAAAYSDYNQAAIWYKQNCGSGETAPTFSGNVNSSYAAALLAEFSGCATSAVVDQTAGYYGTPSGVTNSAVDSAAGDLILGMAHWNGANAASLAAQITGSQGSNLTTNVLASSGTSTAPQYILAWGIGDSTLGSNADTFTGSFTSGGPDNTPNNIIASFKAA